METSTSNGKGTDLESLVTNGKPEPWTKKAIRIGAYVGTGTALAVHLASDILSRLYISADVTAHKFPELKHYMEKISENPAMIVIAYSFLPLSIYTIVNHIREDRRHAAKDKLHAEKDRQHALKDQETKIELERLYKIERSHNEQLNKQG